MKNYIALLRGINVSGKNLLRMNLLKEIFEGLGWERVTTYIQSGNVVFRAADTATDMMEERIREAIRIKAGLEVPVMVIEHGVLEKILQANPLTEELAEQPDKLHITLLSADPLPERLEGIDPEKFLPDRFRASGRAIYLFCPNGYGQTKLTNTFFEGRLKLTATTRNLKTLSHLLSISAP